MNVTYKYDPEYHRFADYMGIDAFERQDLGLAQKLSLLYDWAQTKSRSKDYVKVVEALDKARRQAGVTFTGKELINFMYQRARLEMDNQRHEPDRKPTKRERYDPHGSKEALESAQASTDKAKKEGKVADRENVRYIEKHKQSMVKPKPDKIPTIEHPEFTSVPVE